MRISNENFRCVAENLARYYENECTVCERVSANLSEAAKYAAANFGKAAADPSRTGELLPEGCLPLALSAAERLETVLSENRALAAAKLSATEGAYLADLCRKVTAELKSSRFRPCPAVLIRRETAAVNRRVALTGSRILGDALEVFAKTVPGLRATHAGSFAEACEAVADGACGYCILPVENSRDGELLSVYGLLERYDLFVTCVCSMQSEEITTKYALICHGFRGMIDVYGEQTVVVRLAGQDDLTLPRLFTGASVIGAHFVKAVSVPFSYTDGYAHLCTFTGSGEALFALMLFLDLIRADYTLMGNYGILHA